MNELSPGEAACAAASGSSVNVSSARGQSARPTVSASSVLVNA
jgi:hypothetical protein